MIPYNDDYCIQSVLRGFVLFAEKLIGSFLGEAPLEIRS